MAQNSNEPESVSIFREYLKIKSVHPKPDYVSAADFLINLGKQYGLESQVVEYTSGKPIVLLTWKGTDPTLPSVLLNSHTDVVPADESQWNFDPFGATKDSNGNIYARGTQDMKSVTIQHLVAVGNLKQKHKSILRNLHLAFVPDEEIGGSDGMAKFVESAEFANLNIGVALDEGLASPDDSMTVFYGERAAWWVLIRAKGPTGHGSRLIENTAVERLMKVVNKLLTFRQQQFEELQRGIAQCGMKLGDVTTVNLTALKAGVTTDGKNFSLNVIPSEALAGFDIRIPPTVNLDEFENQIKSWTEEQNCTYELVGGQDLKLNKSTDISDDSKWWKLFKESLDKQGLKLDPQIFPAATDSRYIRQKNIPAFGFSPLNNTPILLHDHNEFINEKIFLKGIEIFETLILDLVNSKF